LGEPTGLLLDWAKNAFASNKGIIMNSTFCASCEWQRDKPKNVVYLYMFLFNKLFSMVVSITTNSFLSNPASSA
jgi:hypothetical protein